MNVNGRRALAFCSHYSRYLNAKGAHFLILVLSRLVRVRPKLAVSFVIVWVRPALAPNVILTFVAKISVHL